MNQNTRMTITAGILIAVGIVLPMAFHAVGIAGPVFLPMHFPVLMAGYLLSPMLALFVGVLTPTLSSFMTGMPPAYPILPIMIIELGLYGLTVALIRNKTDLNTYFLLIISMVVGRIGAGLTVFILVAGFGLKMNPVIYIQAAIVNGLPGIAIQLIMIPAIVKAIKLAGFNPNPN